MTIIFNQSVEVASPVLIESPYSSEPDEDWSNPVWAPVDFAVSVQPGSVQPGSSQEGPEERPQVVSGWVLITPPGTDIPELSEASRVRVGGTLVMNVRGTPARWPDPFHPGVVHHLEAEMEVVSG